MARFTVFRAPDDAWTLGPFGGWCWEPLDGEQTDYREYITRCSARRAAKRALRHERGTA